MVIQGGKKNEFSRYALKDATHFSISFYINFLCRDNQYSHTHTHTIFLASGTLLCSFQTVDKLSMICFKTFQYRMGNDSYSEDPAPYLK